MPYIKHRPEVGWSQVEDTPEGEARVWRVQCACGTTSATPHYRYDDAVTAVEEHEAAMAPPPDKACRDPRKHRTKAHDWCALCADQLLLPGFEHLEVAG